MSIYHCLHLFPWIGISGISDFMQKFHSNSAGETNQTLFLVLIRWIDMTPTVFLFILIWWIDMTPTVLQADWRIKISLGYLKINSTIFKSLLHVCNHFSGSWTFRDAVCPPSSEKGIILEVWRQRETEIKFDFSLIVEIVHVDKVTINNWKIFNGIKILIFKKNYMFLEIFYDLK